MRLAVVGAGAMGGALAAETAAAGHDVHVLEVNREMVDTINRVGLTVRSESGELVQEVRASSDAAEIGTVDVVVVFVKAHHTRSAAEAIAPLCGESTVLASLQNGWGNSDVLAALHGTSRLVFGVTYHSCSVEGVARIAHTGRGETVIGPYAEGSMVQAERLAELLISAGWPTRIEPQVRTEIWKKVILNAATLPTAALTGLPAGDLAAEPEMRALIDGAAAEACAVARAMGLDVEVVERITRIHEILDGAGRGKASMLQDVLARRKTELEVINEAVVRAGDEHGVEVPLNRALVALIRGLERSWTL